MIATPPKGVLVLTPANRGCEAKVHPFYADGTAVDVYFDWFGLLKKKLQLVVTPADSEAATIYVRFNDNGSIHSIVIDEQLSDLVKLAGGPPDDWMKERDGVTVFPEKPDDSTWWVSPFTNYRDPAFSNITEGAF